MNSTSHRISFMTINIIVIRVELSNANLKWHLITSDCLSTYMYAYGYKCIYVSIYRYYIYAIREHGRKEKAKVFSHPCNSQTWLGILINSRVLKIMVLQLCSKTLWGQQAVLFLQRPLGDSNVWPKVIAGVRYLATCFHCIWLIL